MSHPETEADGDTPPKQTECPMMAEFVDQMAVCQRAIASALESGTDFSAFTAERFSSARRFYASVAAVTDQTKAVQLAERYTKMLEFCAQFSPEDQYRAITLLQMCYVEACLY